MTLTGRATYAMIRTTACKTYYRACNWFKNNPTATYAYWGRDEFLSDKATPEEKDEFVNRHPEINDLYNHSTVRILNDSIIIGTLCPRLKAGVEEMISAGVVEGCEKGAEDCYVAWDIGTDDSIENYIITLYKVQAPYGQTQNEEVKE